jgi:threonine dehydratase
MAGQGTIAAEILDQLDSEPDLVIVPVGGGGCIAGITTYLAERTTNTSVVGVEPAGAAAMIAALAPGEPVTLDHVDQFVDGRGGEPGGNLTVRSAGRGGGHGVDHHSRRGCGVHRDARPVPERGHHRRTRGALSVAALMEADIEPESTVVCLISGGNNDVSRYNEVLERSLVHLGSSTTSWWTSRRSRGRCAGSSTRCSAQSTTSRYSSTSSATIAIPVRPLVGIELGSAAISRVCWRG